MLALSQIPNGHPELRVAIVAVSVLPEALVSHRRIIEVVAAVIERDSEILVCRRRPEKAAGGKWEFPGGKLEPGETNSEALVREIQEELGVAIEVTGPLRTDDTTVGENVIRLICLCARLVGEAPTRSVDHDELRWVARAELPSLDWAAPDLPAVAQLAGVDIS
ncbi:(deoxy)nucleoside triphosphate pyrophosphohydrolase [Microbacterium sp. NPDC089695]|uniref:(deoxy)nucleoside triphosphate pyrophosphohydrolase n=1 Tax=Microbacterium sp. NPDC089695 TaxID=3364198 RepID=UPI0037FE6E88